MQQTVSTCRRRHPLVAALTTAALLVLNTRTAVHAFVVRTRPTSHHHQLCSPVLSLASKNNNNNKEQPTLERVSPDLEGIPIPFVDRDNNSFIECYADSVAHIDGAEYTIGVPCDYAVALTQIIQSTGELVPIELDDDEVMDDVFPVAESIVAEEFGEELVLQRTPQTLTLVGELEDDEEDFEEDDNLSMLDEDDDDDDEEEVEVLLSFEHRGKEFHLVRMLDPILLVGKKDDEEGETDNRFLLTKEESDAVMPLLEDMFLEFNDDPDAMLP